MMHAMDRGIGRVIAALDESGQRENTLIVFLSDNGGATSNASWNGPLSGAKGSCREGGVRVPMIWNWPGHIGPNRLQETVASSLDLLPTFLAAANGKPLPLQAAPSYHDRGNVKRANKKYGEYDGINLLPALLTQAKTPERTLFWRLQGQAAVRKGNLKLIRPTHRPAQLFAPKTDLGEQTDLAADATVDLHSLFSELGAWEASLPTTPIWGSSPYWSGNSAKIYDTWQPRLEPK